jgi:eukaryotic-like serine/threonine-protein kinase
VLILIVGMLAPARPAKMFIAASTAASMDPLAVWLAHLRGLPVPSSINTLLLFYPNYVCAVLAVAPARLVYRFGRQISEARALGSYELVERLGEGGMGEVWLARHRLLARGAAIKLIRSDAFNSGRPDHAAATMRRFEREARATASLTSPHSRGRWKLSEICIHISDMIRRSSSHQLKGGWLVPSQAESRSIWMVV